MDKVLPQVSDEIEALAAIYGPDSVKNLKAKAPWGTVNAAVEFQLLLNPLDDNLKDKVACTLLFKFVSLKILFKHVPVQGQTLSIISAHSTLSRGARLGRRLPSLYPKAAAHVTIAHHLGLSTPALNRLQALLTAKAQRLINIEGSLFELAQLAAEFISDNHAIILGGQDSLITQKDARTAQERQVRRMALGPAPPGCTDCSISFILGCAGSRNSFAGPARAAR